MKQFFVSLAANFVTIAILVVGFFVVVIGLASLIGKSSPILVEQNAVLVIDLDETLVDAPADATKRSAFDDAISGGDAGLSLRAALRAVRAAADDDRISGILIRGGAVGTGYGALRELRGAISDFRTKSSKPVYAFLVNPETRDYYVASAASNITIDPFGTMYVPGISAEAVFLSGFLEKYGIGVQVTRVGRFKAAVEPLTRTTMSPENREQTKRYVGAIWSEVKSAVSLSRGLDTVAFQQIVDDHGIITPEVARSANLVDRVGYWDVVLSDLLLVASVSDSSSSVATAANESDSAASSDSVVAGDSSSVSASTTATRTTRTSRKLSPASLPQVSLSDYAIIAANSDFTISADQKIAIVYATGDIVDGEGGTGLIGGDALARDLRKIRNDSEVKAVVLRVNSPGGSAVASETMQRELVLLAANRPVVVSMGNVAASGGYWISTAATRIFAQPNTITGSIGVFGLMPNLQRLANNHGITFDTVKTGKYADLFSLSRPRNSAELAVIQRSVDVVYDAFIERVATARKLSQDSVRVIAEGRVWSGEDALRIGLVDSIGGLDDAIKSAASLASLTGDYTIVEYPKHKGAAELLTEMFERNAPPVAGESLRIPVGNTQLRSIAGSILNELNAVLTFNDPRNSYARMSFILNVR